MRLSGAAGGEAGCGEGLRGERVLTGYTAGW